MSLGWIAAWPCAGLIFSADILAAQAVHGRLLDELTGDPIVGAVVTLLDGRERSIRSANTNTDGAFVLVAPRVGSYRLRAEAMGYERAISPPVDLPDRDVVHVELRLSVDAIPLAPLTVISGRGEIMHPRLERWGYYERRAMWQSFGARFFDHAEIQRRHPWTLTGVLRTVPELRFHHPGGRVTVITDRRGRPLTLCLDGMRGFRVEDLDQLPLSQVLAIEIYVSSSVRDNARCDIMTWTGIP